MSSKVRNAEKRRERIVKNDQLDRERAEKESYFLELTTKLDELGIDPALLKEYLDYI